MTYLMMIKEVIITKSETTVISRESIAALPIEMQPQTQKAKVHSSYIPKSGQLLLTTVQQKSR